MNHPALFPNTTAALRRLTTLLAASLLLLLATACKDDPQIHLTGEIKGLTQPDILFLGFRPDTCPVLPIAHQAGHFTLDFLPDPNRPPVLILDGKTEIPLFAQPGDEVRVKGDMRNPQKITVEGGEQLNQDLNQVRANTLKPEDFIQKYPDHLASAWLLRYLTAHGENPDTKRLRKMHGLLTPRLAQHELLRDVQEEFGRKDFFHELEIPHFGRPAHVLIQQPDSAHNLDTVLTNEQLNQELRKRLN